jgi:signal transduction histidine kinase
VRAELTQPAAGRLAFSLRRPRTTVRWRLTLLYGGLFLGGGVVLLTITYILVAHAAISPAHRPLSTLPQQIQRVLRTREGQALITPVGSRQRIADLHELLLASGIALAIMTIGSALLGWLVAGRVLRPLRTITARTKQISATNLHERLAMQGASDELRELGDTIDRLIARLEEAFEAQRQFVANASHELRTPLAIMRTTLDVAVAKPEGVPPQLKALDANLRQNLDHADQLLESFLVLARAQHGWLSDRTSVSLKRMITAALAARQDVIAERQIDVSTALVPASVTGSETLLTRMVENVIENAVIHNQPHGFISITCKVDDDRVRLVVDSGGELLDKRQVATLAKPFRRLGVDRTYLQTGHGLGLSIIAAIVAAHDGRLKLHARSQGGLRVEIMLPDATLVHGAGAQQ